MKLPVILLAFIAAFNVFSNPRFEKWQMEGYFRGYNILYENPKVLQDFKDFRNYGGNLLQIGTDGFLNEDAPYGLMESNIAGTDQLVNYCRQAGIYYVIAVRSGPGAYDTYEESNGLKPESRIWNPGNVTEQTKYAEMLKMIVDRYNEDTLFAGIDIMVEPRPKVKSIPANTSQLYKFFLERVYNIRMDLIYNQWVDEIRTIDSTLPVILENFGYSTAELFPGYDIADPYIIYSAHLYMPREYTHADGSYSLTYPGTYFSLTYLSQQLYNRNFLNDVVLKKVKEYSEASGKPVILGEFGMILPQTGGEVYINDVLSICKENGWHFALWDWRRGQGQQWNIEAFEGDDNTHWKTVLSHFHAPPLPEIISPGSFGYIDTRPVFTWDSMTAFTMFDLQILQDSNVKFEKTNITGTSYTYTEGNLQEGIIYTWRMRSKNPGNSPENASAWTTERQIYIPVPDKPFIEKSISVSNYPNPFNPSTIISISLPDNLIKKIKLNIYNSLGQLIETLIDGNYSGVQKVKWPSGSVSYPSGIYFYSLLIDGSVIHTKRMLLIK